MHSCGVTRNIRKGYAIASFHSFGSSHGAHFKAAEVQSAGHQFAPLCDENSSLRAQRNLGIAEPGGSALAHIGGFAAQQEVVARRPAAKIDAIATYRKFRAAQAPVSHGERLTGNLARALARLEPRPAPVQRRNSTGHRSELADRLRRWFVIKLCCLPQLCDLVGASSGMRQACCCTQSGTDDEYGG